MFRLIKQAFIGLLSFRKSLAMMANVSKFGKCISLTCPPSMTRTTVIDLNPDEYNQELHFSQLTAKMQLGRCNVMFK